MAKAQISTLDNLKKLMDSVDYENEVKPNDRLKDGSKKDINFWLNRGWILPNNYAKFELTRPGSFHITQLALDSYEFAKRNPTNVQ